MFLRFLLPWEGKGALLLLRWVLQGYPSRRAGILSARQWWNLRLHGAFWKPASHQSGWERKSQLPTWPWTTQKGWDHIACPLFHGESSTVVNSKLCPLLLSWSWGQRQKLWLLTLPYTRWWVSSAPHMRTQEALRQSWQFTDIIPKSWALLGTCLLRFHVFGPKCASGHAHRTHEGTCGKTEVPFSLMPEKVQIPLQISLLVHFHKLLEDLSSAMNTSYTKFSVEVGGKKRENSTNSF